MTETQKDDKVYSDEAVKAIGRAFAHVFKGMLENGMAPDYAERALHVYIMAFAQQKPDKEKDAGH